MNSNTEVLTQVFTINSRRQVTIDPGRYNYTRYFITWRGDPSAVLSVSGRYAIGAFLRRLQAFVSGWPDAASEQPAQHRRQLEPQRHSRCGRGRFTTDLITASHIKFSDAHVSSTPLLQYNTRRAAMGARTSASTSSTAR